MGLFDKMKAWGSDIKDNMDLKKKVQNNEDLTPEERTFFIDKNKKTPEEYKIEWDQEQARIAEQRRISALDRSEEKINIDSLFLRHKNGLYYFDKKFNEHAVKYYLVDFQWSGPVYESTSNTVTTGKDKKSSNAGKALAGSMLFGPTGAIVGAAGKKTTKINRTSTTTTTQNEVDSSASLVFVSVDGSDKIFKTIKCNSNIAKKVMSLKYTSL